MKNENSNLEFRKLASLDFKYEINSNGTIFRNSKSKKQNKIIVDHHHSINGYHVTFVHLNGRTENECTKRIMISHAVAEAWLGKKPDGLEVDHIDRNSLNDDYRNLRYVTKSEQMKNRDHSGISEQGKINLQIARDLRAKPVSFTKGGETRTFSSFAEADSVIGAELGKSKGTIHDRLRRHREHIHGYDVKYLNAETKHNGSPEQEIVQRNVDLTSDYKTAFNPGKIDETDHRVKHR